MKAIFEKHERKAGRGGKAISITRTFVLAVTSDNKKDQVAVLNMVREDKPGSTFELMDIAAYDNAAAYKAAADDRADKARKEAALASLKRLSPEQIAALRGMTDEELEALETQKVAQAAARKAEEEAEAKAAKDAAEAEALATAGAGAGTA